MVFNEKHQGLLKLHVPLGKGVGGRVQVWEKNGAKEEFFFKTEQ